MGGVPFSVGCLTHSLSETQKYLPIPSPNRFLLLLAFARLLRMAEYALSHVAPLLYPEPGKKGVIEKQSGPQGLPLFILKPALSPGEESK